MFAVTKDVMRGENVLAEYLLRREPGEDVVLLYSASAMMCALVYVCGNYLHCATYPNV